MNPYLITGPALISFSGGRTSAYMLHQILKAHHGRLPSGVRVVFANTGKEREETLRFVHECSVRWEVRINWIEWTPDAPGFDVVGFNSASRNGEPFKKLLTKKGMPPNWQARFCTEFLKVKAMMAFMLVMMELRPGEFAEVIGLRADEPARIMKMLARNEKEGRRCVAPLAGRGPKDPSGVTVDDVLRFWLGPTKRMAAGDEPQGFDLGLEPWEGNCDLCFLKGRKLKKHLIRERPESADWWIAAEEDLGGFFDRRDQYRALAAEVRQQPGLFDQFDPADYDVECGLLCGPGE